MKESCMILNYAPGIGISFCSCLVLSVKSCSLLILGIYLDFYQTCIHDVWGNTNGQDKIKLGRDNQVHPIWILSDCRDEHLINCVVLYMTDFDSFSIHWK